MSSMDNQELMRAIIMDHYENPKHLIANPNKLNNYHSHNIQSPSCIDNITAHIKINEGKIKDVVFSGIGCAITTASSDIMSQLLIGKTINEANAIINNYLDMVDGKEYNSDLVGDLYVFKNIKQQLNRIKCAKVGPVAMQTAIKNSK